MGSKEGEVKVLLEGFGEAGESMENEEQEVGHLLFYKNCYSEALNVILDNLSRGGIRRIERRKEAFCFGTVPEDESFAENSNIIAFIGRRGSGKTTVIREFCSILRSYQNKSEKWNRVLSYKGRKDQERRFYVMTPIDASVLDKKEDLIELIWANMYQEFERCSRIRNHSCMDDELDKRILREFDEVYKNYVNVGHEERREVLGESVLVKLKNISSSLKTRETFMTLVTDFLRLLDGEDYRGDSALVITVDDLDMNIEKGYEMLDQLHKYLANRRIVILTAIDYEQMRLVCERDFLDVLTPKKGKWSNADELKEKAKRLSNDYLLKVIPLSNRIYIPGRDVISKRSLVAYGNQTEPIKRFLLAKIAEKMDIYYDAIGSKKHFCLPDTVREFMTYNSFLDSLISMEEIEAAEPSRRVLLYDQNHERFNRDITDRMALQILDESQLKVFELILGKNIEKRAAYAVNFIHNRLDELKKRNGIYDFDYVENEESYDEDENSFQDRVDGQNDYCYGDLLNVIYVLGRMQYSDKPLVHCLLASFTSEMVRENYSYWNNIDPEARKRAADRLKNFLGLSFGGKWLGNNMPKAVRTNWGVTLSQEDESEFRIGYIKDGQMSNVEIKGYFDSDDINEIDRFAFELTEMVPYLECLTLLFSNFKDDTHRNIYPQWQFELVQGSREDKQIRFLIRSNATSADFDVFGFLGKEIADEDLKNRLTQSFTENITSSIVKHISKMKKHIELSEKTIKEKVEKSVRNNSIWKGTRQEETVFPYYSLDMSYNIMKRVRRKIKETGKIEAGRIYDFFLQVYGFVACELKKEEEGYAGCGEREKLKLYDNFVQSPFINAFGIKCVERKKLNRQTKLREEHFNNIFYQVLGSIGLDHALRLDEQNFDMEIE